MDHPYRILTIGCSGSRETNTFLTLINYHFTCHFEQVDFN